VSDRASNDVSLARDIHQVLPGMPDTSRCVSGHQFTERSPYHDLNIAENVATCLLVGLSFFACLSRHEGKDFHPILVLRL
jgi:hypothetical protein